jgi:NAD(P)H-dependent FMN reductase
MERPLFLPILLGTPRQGRQSEHVARFVFEQMKKRAGIETELFDEGGNLLDENYVRRVDTFLNELIWMTRVLRYGRANVPPV